MSFDPGWLFLSLLTGAVGLALFMYGKREGRVPHLVIGLAFMVYPYFTPNVPSMLIVGGLLGSVLWYLIRTGR